MEGANCASWLTNATEPKILENICMREDPCSDIRKDLFYGFFTVSGAFFIRIIKAGFQGVNIREGTVGDLFELLVLSVLCPFFYYGLNAFIGCV
jgi:hypothetical protein